MAKRKPPATLLEIQKMLWKDYIKTPHWVKFRRTLDTDDAKCEICDRPKWEFYKRGKNKGMRKTKPTCRFNVHHKHYNNIGRESREDVLLLCSSCHGTCHDLATLSRTRGGVYKTLYDIICSQTKWEYTPFKDRKFTN